MKSYLARITTLLVSLLFSTVVFAVSTSTDILQQMRHAILTLDYEFHFINVNRGSIESLRYRHAVVNDQPLAQLLQMDGASREILMRGSEVSYFFEKGVEPFSISGDHIIDGMPSIVFADFQRLEKYYDFIPVGQARIANRICQVIRVVAKDGFRYSYIIWVDDSSKLPLQVDLLDRNGTTLEQFRVVSIIVDNQVKHSMSGLINLQLPPLLPQPIKEPIQLNWTNSWVPDGFVEVISNRHKLLNLASAVESRLFSDGLFSFSVNILPAENESSSQYLSEGRKTIYMEVRQGNEIVVVGDIPQNTAERIANAVVFDKE